MAFLTRHGRESVEKTVHAIAIVKFKIGEPSEQKVETLIQELFHPDVVKNLKTMLKWSGEHDTAAAQFQLGSKHGKAAIKKEDEKSICEVIFEPLGIIKIDIDISVFANADVEKLCQNLQKHYGITCSNDQKTLTLTGLFKQVQAAKDELEKYTLRYDPIPEDNSKSSAETPRRGSSTEEDNSEALNRHKVEQTGSECSFHLPELKFEYLKKKHSALKGMLGSIEVINAGNNIMLKSFMPEVLEKVKQIYEKEKLIEFETAIPDGAPIGELLEMIQNHEFNEIHFVAQHFYGDILRCVSSEEHEVDARSHLGKILDQVKRSGLWMKTTLDNIAVNVYQGDITKLKCDAVVNAANRQLQQWGGVAGAILSASGADFQHECNKRLREFGGELPDGQVLTVRASGKLKDNHVKYVINAVGPRYHDVGESYNNQHNAGGRRDSGNHHEGGRGQHSSSRDEKCLKLITDAIYNSLIEADKLECTSIAIPAISSGIYGVPMTVCTLAYTQGLRQFVESRERKHIKEIDFVDIEKETARAIQEAFKDLQLGWY